MKQVLFGILIGAVIIAALFLLLDGCNKQIQPYVPVSDSAIKADHEHMLDSFDVVQFHLEREIEVWKDVAEERTAEASKLYSDLQASRKTNDQLAKEYKRYKLIADTSGMITQCDQIMEQNAVQGLIIDSLGVSLQDAHDAYEGLSIYTDAALQASNDVIVRQNGIIKRYADSLGMCNIRAVQVNRANAKLTRKERRQKFWTGFGFGILTGSSARSAIK